MMVTCHLPNCQVRKSFADSHTESKRHQIRHTTWCQFKCNRYARQAVLARPYRYTRKSPKQQFQPCKAALQAEEISDKDRCYMLQALELAKRALGKTEPNPAVGCVIVKDDQVVGQGFHPKAGMPHAEVYALRAAGRDGEGATAYVTLEPCNHHGKTPPCSQALLAARVARVVVGVVDPNPLVGGEGIRTLKKAGVQVLKIGGKEELECYAINESFMKGMEAGSKA